MEKTLQGFKQAFTTAPGLSAFAASLLLTPSAFFGLFLMMDYATGILAAWTEHRKKMDSGRLTVDNDRHAARERNCQLSTVNSQLNRPYFISSDRLRGSAAKVIGYLLVIAFAAFLDMAFFHGGVHLPGTERPPMTAAEIAISACTAVEFLSNLENLKRSGFDLLGKLHSAMDSAWKTVRKAKGERE